jgi:hypothetical protein
MIDARLRDLSKAIRRTQLSPGYPLAEREGYLVRTSSFM